MRRDAMFFRLLAGGLPGLVCGAAVAQPPAIPTPAVPVPATPVPATPVPATPAPVATAPAPDAAAPQTWTASVQPAGGKPVDGAAALPKALADARQAITAARDYTAGMVRQERVNGTLLPEQGCAIVARTKPASVSVRVAGPKPYAGTVTSFVDGRGYNQVRHRAAGPDGLKPFQTLSLDDPAARTGARHPVTGYGLLAVLDRAEAAARVRKAQHKPTQVLVADYTFAGKPVRRYEVFADGAPADSPARMVLCFDAGSKLLVRAEAYGPATADAPGGEVLEVVSFVNVRLNAGVGDAAFER